MLQAVIYYMVTATDQCTEYQFKSLFFPGVSCEDIYSKNPESRNKSGIHDSPKGCTEELLCSEDVYNNNPDMYCSNKLK